MESMGAATNFARLWRRRLMAPPKAGNENLVGDCSTGVSREDAFDEEKHFSTDPAHKLSQTGLTDCII